MSFKGAISHAEVKQSGKAGGLDLHANKGEPADAMEDEEFSFRIRQLMETGKDHEAGRLTRWRGDKGLLAYLEQHALRDQHDPWLFNQACRAYWMEGEWRGLESFVARHSSEKVAHLRAGWKLLVAVSRGDRSGLRAGLERLVRSDEALGDFPRFFLLKLAKFKCSGLADAVLRSAVHDDTINMVFAELVTERACHARSWEVRREFGAWVRRCPKAAAVPVSVYLKLIAELDPLAAAREVPALIEEARDWLGTQASTFGHCGNALLQARLYKEAAEWLQGCEQRSDIEGWIVAINVMSLWHAGAYDHAGRVAEVALERDLQDSTWDWNVVAAAFGRALAGDMRAAREHLLRFTGDSPLRDDFSWVLELTRSMIRVSSEPQANARDAYHGERLRLRDWLAENGIDPVIGGVEEFRFILALKVMASAAGIQAHLWHARLMSATARSFVHLVLIFLFIVAASALLVWYGVSGSTTRELKYSVPPAADDQKAKLSAKNAR